MVQQSGLSAATVSEAWAAGSAGEAAGSAGAADSAESLVAELQKNWFGGASGYGSSVRSSSSKRDYDVAEPPRKLDLDGLTPFEKNVYVESPSVAAMLEKEVEEY
ncbi:hypothetical protein Q3G72_006507 [Acer saccharum]|nr:hypothetical protein Q3G72_006507 [Acer saccharum]